MMLEFRTLTSKFKEKELVIFERGKFAKPLLILGVVDIERLLKEYKS